MARAVWILVVIATACRNTSPDQTLPESSITTDRGVVSLTQMTLPQSLRGISGLSVAGDGTFWAVPERDRRIFRIAVGPQAASIAQQLPIRGAPNGEDLESVALLSTSPTELVFGCETTATRTADRVVKGTISSKALTIDVAASAPWSVDYKPWSMTPGRNRGLEALCISGGQILTISESVKEANGARLAPVALRPIEGASTWRRRTLRLTSDEGKISAVACRFEDPGRLTAIAVERHFGVMRIVRFTIDTRAEPAAGGPLAEPIDLETVVDLRKAYRRAPPPNFEGIAWPEPKTLVLISDNDYRGVSGLTTVLRIGLP